MKPAHRIEGTTPESTRKNPKNLYVDVRNSYGNAWMLTLRSQKGEELNYIRITPPKVFQRLRLQRRGRVMIRKWYKAGRAKAKREAVFNEKITL